MSECKRMFSKGLSFHFLLCGAKSKKGTFITQTAYLYRINMYQLRLLSRGSNMLVRKNKTNKTLEQRKNYSQTNAY
jgi:hypothetical protein